MPSSESSKAGEDQKDFSNVEIGVTRKIKPWNRGRLPSPSIEASICGFMMFHGKDLLAERIAAKYKHMGQGRIMEITRLRRILAVDVVRLRRKRTAHMIWFFRVDENNASIRGSGGEPISYYGQRKNVFTALAIQEVKRYDYLARVRLMYNSSTNQTWIVLLELGYADGNFYSKELSLEKLRESISHEALLKGVSSKSHDH